MQEEAGAQLGGKDDRSEDSDQMSFSSVFMGQEVTQTPQPSENTTEMKQNIQCRSTIYLVPPFSRFAYRKRRFNTDGD